MKIHIFLVFYALLLLQSLSAQNTAQIAVNNFVASTEFANASISISAIDLASGETIASYNPNLSIPTASTAKLFSTATAIEILGPNYQPETRIYIDGQIDNNGTLNGNLWIRGGGDVSLGSKYFNEAGHEGDFLNRWVDTLQKLGIKSITGSIIADGSEFGYAGVPEGWSWNDMGNYYGAGPSGIVIYDNMIRYRFKSGPVGSTTELKSTFPVVPNLVLHNYITAGNVNGDNSFIYGGPYSLDRFSAGTLPANQAAFEVKGSMPDPEFQLAYELCAALIRSKINVGQGPKSVRQLDLQKTDRYSDPQFKLIYSYKGAKIQDIATVTNMKSVNLFAEGLVCLVGYRMAGNGSTAEGLKQIEKYWSAKFNLSGLFLKDGSGLSRSNGISAMHFCTLLKAMSNSVNFNSYYKTLPVAGKSGTLYSLCRDQAGEGRIIAKSGTMSKIKSYAGYINSKSGKRIAFSITINNYNCTNSQLVTKMERILNVLAVY